MLSAGHGRRVVGDVRLKNNGYHDLIVRDTEDGETVHIQQHGRHGEDVIVVSMGVVPLLVAALQEIARG